MSEREHRRTGLTADGCSLERSLVSIDSETPDPLGTRYKNGSGSFFGGLKIARIMEGENWFRLDGYSKPIFCEESLCAELTVGIREWLPQYAEFELVEIDGEREIAVVSGDGS